MNAKELAITQSLVAGGAVLGWIMNKAEIPLVILFFVILAYSGLSVYIISITREKDSS